jgi:hypothetical protein
MTLTIGRWGEYQSIIWRNSEGKEFMVMINTVSRLAFVEPLLKSPSVTIKKIIKAAFEKEQPITKLQINREVEEYKDSFQNIPYIILNNNFHSLGIAFQLGNQLRLSKSNSTREIHKFIEDWNNKKHSTTKIEPSNVNSEDFMKIQAETYIREIKQKLKK